MKSGLLKKHHGNTELYSLNDFKEHNTIKIKEWLFRRTIWGAYHFIGNLEN